MDSDAGLALLGGILPGSYARLEQARRLVRPEWLAPAQRDLLIMLGNYADLTGEVMPRGALVQSLAMRQAAAGVVQMYQEVYDIAAGIEVTQGQFTWALQVLRDQAATRATGTAITEAYEILDRGIDDGKGGRLAGAAAARERLLQRIAEIDSDLSSDAAPEGDVRAEFAQITAAYNDAVRRRQSGADPGIALGLPTIDQYIGGGLRRGELCMVVGNSTSGKTSLCVSIAWHACVIQARNVVFFTAETLRGELTGRLLARHSRHPKFAAEIPAGLDSLKIRAGTLGPEEQAWYHEVARDFTSGPNYGRCYVAQMPYGETLGSLFSRLNRIGRLFQPDLVIIDYLQLVKADRRRDAAHEEAGGLLQAAKQFAPAFGGGLGVPVISPWQVNRSGRERALSRDRGFYTNLDLAATAEAFNTPDVVLTLVDPERVENQRAAQLKGELIKNRNGPRGAPVRLTADYATCLFEEGEFAGAGGSALAGDDISSLVLLTDVNL